MPRPGALRHITESQIKLDLTNEGLRIQIVDDQNRPTFDIGSSRLKVRERVKSCLLLIPQVKRWLVLAI
jgi:chemotaxis protein MotB